MGRCRIEIVTNTNVYSFVCDLNEPSTSVAFQILKKGLKENLPFIFSIGNRKIRGSSIESYKITPLRFWFF